MKVSMGRSILLIEDEVILSMILDEDLRERGYQVRVATSGGDGLEAIESGEPFEVLVTDIRLPDLDGWTLARRARELNPQVAVIYMTGDSAADHLRNGVSDSAMLPKPFLAEALAEAVSTHVG